jgi:hypothetical protein
MINYKKLLDEALLGFVKKILLYIQSNSIDSPLYFTFATEHPEVILPIKVREQYPKEITIVLQHQFEDLAIFNDKFSVILSFNGIQEKVVVPFDAILAISDPAANFGIHLSDYDDLNGSFFLKEDEGGVVSINPESFIKKDKTTKKMLQQKEAEIVSLDSFRKNPSKK